MGHPLKITWRLSTPAVLPGGFPLHLDALLAYARVQEALRSGHPDPYQAQEGLPLEAQAGVWKASQLIFTPKDMPRLFPMVRKFDPHALALDRGVKYGGSNQNTFPAGTGHFKAYDLRFPYQWMEKVEAYCVGDEDEVRRLLNSIAFIGKITRNGFGRVASMTVEPCEQAQTLWRIRALPQGADLEIPGGHYEAALQCVRPPYWEVTRRQPAAVPLFPADLVRVGQ